MSKIIQISSFCIMLLLMLPSCDSIHLDPLFDKQWYLANQGPDAAILAEDAFDYVSKPKESIDIDALNMWAHITKRNEFKQVIVAVIDTGIDYTNEELKHAMWINSQEILGNGIDDDGNGYIDDIYGYNFCDDNGDVLAWNKSELENQHGTLCAGIIVAAHNGQGIMGIAAPINAKIMSLKVLNSETEINTGSIENLIKAIQYAEANGANICNISINIESNDEILADIIRNSSMLFVVSAGNGYPRGRNIDFNPSYPASYDMENVISVANLNFNGALNKTSNWGPVSVDIAAPGTMIISTSVGGDYSFVSGTSMAAPIVSGIAALIYACESDDIDASVDKKIICDSAMQLDSLKQRVASGGFVSGNKIFTQMGE